MKERISSVNKCFTSDLYREIDMCLEKKDMLAAAFVLAVQMKPVDVHTFYIYLFFSSIFDKKLSYTDFARRDEAWVSHVLRTN